MTRWALVADLRRCVGCQTCTASCKHANATPPGVQWRRVLGMEFGEYPDVQRVFVPVGCQHCADPPCLDVCPSTATRKRPDDRTWQHQPLAHEWLLTNAHAADALSLQLQLRHVPSALDLTATLQLDSDKPELSVRLEADGELTAVLPYPHPFATESGTHLIVPMNEGITYPVDDPAVSRMRLIAYGGHGICMAFWGVTDGAAAQMAILETPDDAAIRIDRLDQRLVIAPEWDPQHGRFGYARRLRYVFFDRKDHLLRRLCRLCGDRY